MSILEHQNSEQRLEFLYDAIQGGSLFQVQRMLNAMHPAEIADLIEASPQERRQLIWELVEADNEGEVLIELAEDIRNALVEGMDTGEIISALQGLDYDDMADFLQGLPDTLIQQTLAGMDRQERERLETVLAYDEDTAGGMMTPQVATIRADVSIEVVLRHLRRHGNLPQHTDSLIVINRYNRYLGTLPLATILTTDTESMVNDIMENEQQAIPADMPDTHVARLFEDRDLVSAPVVDNSGKLIGRITIDDVVDIIREEADETMMNMARLDNEEDLFSPVLSSAKNRGIWLGTNLLTALLAAWVISQFEATLEATVALAILMGVIPSMGGVAGTQTLTLVIRGLALGQLGKSNTRSLLTKELMVSLMNGVVWAIAVFAIATFAFDNVGIGVIIGLAMIVNLLAASTAGVMLPIIMRYFKIDPALAGGVVLTTITDIVGFAAVLGLATVLLPIFAT